MNKKNIQVELNELSPLLSQLKKGQKREETMPANYFSGFEDRLMHRIQQEEALEPTVAAIPSKSKRNWLSSLLALFRPKYAPQFAFGLVVLCGSFYFVNYFNTQNEVQTESSASTLLAALSLEETETYLIENTADDVAIIEIAVLLEEEEWTSLEEEIEEVLEEEEIIEIITTPKEVSSIKKALQTTDNSNLLEEITEEDLEGYELF